MTIKNLSFVLPLVGVALLAGCAKPVSKAEVQQEIQAKYAASDAAIASKNVDGALAMYSPDCVVATDKGSVTGTQSSRQMMQTVFALPGATLSRTTTIKDLTLNNKQGTEAIVTINQAAEASMGAMGKQKVTTELRDFWVKGKDGWQIKREKLISLNKK